MHSESTSVKIKNDQEIYTGKLIDMSEVKMKFHVM